MTIDELNELFQLKLRRSPDPSDVSSHLSKEYNQFERELENCAEYKNIVNGGVKMFATKGKIAVLLSGHIRKNSIAKSLKKHFDGYDYDVFVHTWEDVGLKGDETNINKGTEKENILSSINSIPNVKKIQMENNKQFINNLSESKVEYFNHSSPEPFIKSQLYSILRSHELMEEYKKETKQKYDLVIKLRFDADVTSAVFSDQFLKEVNSHDIVFTSDIKCHVHTSQGENDSAAGCSTCNNMYYKYGLKEVHNVDHANIICDFYAYGCEKVMKTYCSMYNVYDKICESFTKKNMEHYKKSPAYVFKCGNVYKIRDKECYCDILIDKVDNKKSALHALNYYHISAPEEVLRALLKNYMCLKSINMTARTVR